MKMGAAIAQEVMPDLLEFVEKVTEIVQKVAEWIDKNPALVTALKVLVGVLIGAGGLLIAFSMISKAIIAINMAMAIMHGLMGPVGWAKLAAGIAIAGGAIAGMAKLMDMPTGEVPKVPMPGMQYGGIVPGPIGKPVPIIAHGGEQFAGMGRSLGNIYNVTFNYDISLASESETRDAAQRLLEYIREDEMRTVGVTA